MSQYLITADQFRVESKIKSNQTKLNNSHQEIIPQNFKKRSLKAIIVWIWIWYSLTPLVYWCLVCRLKIIKNLFNKDEMSSIFRLKLQAIKLPFSKVSEMRNSLKNKEQRCHKNILIAQTDKKLWIKMRRISN